jgi:hypothetical protein
LSQGEPRKSVFSLAPRGEMLNRLIAGFFLASLASCQAGTGQPESDQRSTKSRYAKPSLHQKLPKTIFGTWYLSEEHNNFDQIGKFYHLTKSAPKSWPDIYRDDSGQLIFRFTQLSGHNGYNPDDNIETCPLSGIIFASIVDVRYRDFKAICEGWYESKRHTFVFGSKDFAPDIAGFNFRLFGKGFNRLRFTDKNGVEFYFSRAK